EQPVRPACRRVDNETATMLAAAIDHDPLGQSSLPEPPGGDPAGCHILRGHGSCRHGPGSWPMVEGDRRYSCAHIVREIGIAAERGQLGQSQRSQRTAHGGGKEISLSWIAGRQTDHRPDNAEKYGYAEPGNCSLRIVRRAAVALAKQGEKDVANDDG